MNLKKAYDRVHGKLILQVLEIYGIEGKVLHGFGTSYEVARVSIRLAGDMSRCFKVNSGWR